LVGPLGEPDYGRGFSYTKINHIESVKDVIGRTFTLKVEMLLRRKTPLKTAIFITLFSILVQR
jgi:hypothetical protein